MSCASSWNSSGRASSSATSGPSSPFWPNTGEARQACAGGKWLFGPFGIAAMVLGFIVFWPIGLAILAANIAHRRGWSWDNTFTGAPHRMWSRPATGNTAFEDWRQSEIERIERERRKLADAEREFSEFLAELKRAKDREEFERFMQARQGWQPAGTAPSQDKPA